MSIELDLSADVISVEDITERFDELETERDDFVTISEDGTETPDPEKWAAENEEEAEELKQLEELLKEMRGNGGDVQFRGDWYPQSLISVDYWEEYVRELLIDCGYIPKDLPKWIEIDWEKTAENVSEDYTCLEVNGSDYWYR